MAAELALRAALGDDGRQAIGERFARQSPISPTAGQVECRNGKAKFDDRLSQQGMDDIGRPGRGAVAMKGLAGDQCLNLEPFGRRKGLHVLQPGMVVGGRGLGAFLGNEGGGPQGRAPTAPVGRGPRLEERGPPRMGGPAGDAVRGLQDRHGRRPASDQIGDNQMGRLLEEHDVPALSCENRRNAAAGAAAGDIAISIGLSGIERRSQASGKAPPGIGIQSV